MVLSIFDDWYSVPFVKMVQCTIRQKQSKDSQTAKNGHWCTNRHMSTQSPPNTQSRANAATSRDLRHICLDSGHSPSPVGRADSMCLHGRPCVWLPFAAACCYTLLLTDDIIIIIIIIVLLGWRSTVWLQMHKLSSSPCKVYVISYWSFLKVHCLSVHWYGHRLCFQFCSSSIDMFWLILLIIINK